MRYAIPPYALLVLRESDCFLQVECVGSNTPAFIAAMRAEGYRLLDCIDIDYYFAESG